MESSIGSVGVVGPGTCMTGGGGMILPLFGDAEHKWPKPLRTALYASGMAYFFLGVAIIADAFVASIEIVTARRRQFKNKKGQMVTEKVWNDTVATLSLMALGSSAPEIALSVVDLFKKEFYFTPLGAQTIAGSAAFNLLVIVGVCIMVIPSPETRQVQELPAFYVTAAVSVFAYLWLALILIVNSPNVVEVWEAIATFMYLPMLIWVSYKVDVGDLSRWMARLTGKVQREAEPSSRPAFTFSEQTLRVEGSPTESRTVNVTVKRPENTVGTLSVAYRTERLRAVPGWDYTETSGRLHFPEDVQEQTIQLKILPKSLNRVDRRFLLMLEDPRGDVGFSAETDGGEEAEILTVIIAAAPGTGSRLVKAIEGVVNFNGLRRGNEEWKDQILSSVYCLGSAEEQKEATRLDWLGHIVSLPWKLLLSLVPPTSYWGGWACFCSSLLGIGVLTIFISDLAELFGCVLGIRDDVTAIIFVALGTSMPDLFASLTAAKEEPTADSSIVNVTGSNSVNVFLGLGLPWTIGAIYWTLVGQTEEWRERYQSLATKNGITGGAFVVESRNLGFCVLIFGSACAMALVMLHLRRKCIGAELGGPFVPKVAVFGVFILYWLGFILVCSWRVDRWAVATALEAVLVIGGVGAFEVLVTLCAIVILFIYRKRSTAAPANSGQEDKTFRRSQSQQSLGSNCSKSSKASRNKELHKGFSSSSLSEGVMGPNKCQGLGHWVLKPRFVNYVHEQKI